MRLYYGTLDPDHTAYADLVPTWEAQGIHVKHVYSQGKEEYVQHIYAKVSERAGPLLAQLSGPCSCMACAQEGVQDASKACAVLVGQKEMCQAVTEMLVQHGISKDHILLNF